MGKYKFRHGSIQVRVLALTLLFTLGVSVVIAVSNMRQLAAEWERTTLLNAEYALQTAATAIRRDIEEVDDLAGWCAYNANMRTYLLTDIDSNSQALSMYPTVAAKFNSLRTVQYVQRFMLINAAGRQMAFGTAVTNTIAMTPEVLAHIHGYEEDYSGWDCIIRDPMALSSADSQADAGRYQPRSACLCFCLPFPDHGSTERFFHDRWQQPVVADGRAVLQH